VYDYCNKGSEYVLHELYAADGGYCGCVDGEDDKNDDPHSW